MLQRQLSHFNGRKFDHCQVYAAYIFYVWLRLVLYHEHVHSLDFVWFLLVACTILWAKYTEYTVIHFVHSISMTTTNRLILFGRNVRWFLLTSREDINTLCEQNEGFLTAKAGGTYSDRFALHG
jgi:hypothetical protein